MIISLQGIPKVRIGPWGLTRGNNLCMSSSSSAIFRELTLFYVECGSYSLNEFTVNGTH